MAWKKYRSHKIVTAAPIVAISELGTVVVEDDFGIEQQFAPNEPNMAAKASVGDYAVAYEDGYKSVSPKAVFEAGYARID